tara:strand:+ start:2172 stop:4271 length:2100 start_codon:yes stop_codon:yes gene_type:complete
MTSTVQERINETAAQYIKDAFGINELLQIRDYPTKKDAKIEHKKIMDYVEAMISEDCNQDVEYDFARFREDGRRYGKFSIQGVIREVRGLLCDGLTTDIDQINSHPVILKHLCEKNNIPCRNLKTYCADREEVLKEMMIDDNISRSTAKTLILQMTNSTYPLSRKIKGKFITQYAAELKKIQAAIHEIRDYQYVSKLCKTNTNYLGVFMSQLLQIHENIILTSMEEFLIENDYKIHSLMYDGLMVYGNHYDNKELLTQIEKHILEHTEFDMKLSYKHHDTTLSIPEEYQTEESIYQDAKEQFEKNNFKYLDSFVYINNRKEFVVKSIEKFKTIHQEKGHSFLQKWFEDPNKRSYEYMEMYPSGNCPDDCFNMWKPFLAEMTEYSNSVNTAKNEAGLAFYLNHILSLVGDNQEHYEFVLMWLAQMLQYPQHKSVEIVFIGKVGTGKGMLIELLTNILGSTRVFQTANPQRDLYGNFNGNLVDGFLIVQNEANKSNTYGKQDMKKDLITDPTISINIKGGAAFTMKSFHRFITFSNNDDPINLTKGDRRSVVFRDDKKPQPTEYYEKGFEYAEDPDVVKFIYDYLMKHKTKPKINKCDFPENDYQDELVEMNKPICEEFFITFITKDREKNEDFIAVNTLWEGFQVFCKEANYPLTYYNKRDFVKDLYFKLGLSKPIQKKMNGVNTQAVLIDFVDCMIRFC